MTCFWRRSAAGSSSTFAIWPATRFARGSPEPQSPTRTIRADSASAGGAPGRSTNGAVPRNRRLIIEATERSQPGSESSFGFATSIRPHSRRPSPVIRSSTPASRRSVTTGSGPPRRSSSIVRSSTSIAPLACASSATWTSPTTGLRGTYA